jgi:predicted DCC family thiol-disulfide oxidoreductase YuxK
MMMKHPIVFFDGVCNLCNGAVQFLLKHDKKKRLLFASLQSGAGQRHLSDHNLSTKEFHSLMFTFNHKSYQKSDAVLAICKGLGGWFNFMLIFYIVPRPIRDYIYNWIAANRYKWFGKQDRCMVPSLEVRKRFLN